MRIPNLFLWFFRPSANSGSAAFDVTDASSFGVVLNQAGGRVAVPPRWKPREVVLPRAVLPRQRVLGTGHVEVDVADVLATGRYYPALVQGSGAVGLAVRAAGIGRQVLAGTGQATGQMGVTAQGGVATVGLGAMQSTVHISAQGVYDRSLRDQIEAEDELILLLEAA